MSELLHRSSVLDYLVTRNVITADEAMDSSTTVNELSGGVSSVVMAVSARRHALIVKQSLARLRVAEEWLAPTERILSEAAMLSVTDRLTPGRVPPLEDVDETFKVITIAHAPDGWGEWKAQLMAGEVGTSTAAGLGDVLATWHSATTDPQTVPVILRDQSAAFESLRVAPYYRATAHRVPEIGDEIMAVSDRMTATARCLVHGDFSPKNILTPPYQAKSESGDFWVIDHEVAHIGDPTFDVAFLLTHLAMKAVHLPEHAAELLGASAAFVGAYLNRVDARLDVDLEHLDHQVGCLLLARVHGKSPAGYLTPTERTAIDHLGRELLLGDATIVPTTIAPSKRAHT